jgi:hypothetical protein
MGAGERGKGATLVQEPKVEVAVRVFLNTGRVPQSRAMQIAVRR